MWIISLFRNELILRPVYNLLLIFLQMFHGNLWLAIIMLTILVRLLLSKSSSQANEMQSGMGAMQPKMQELQEKYKDNPEKLSQEMMALLKKDGVWPLKWCLGILLQMPVFLWLYAVVSNIANPTEMQSWMKFPTSLIDMAYSFVYPYAHQMIDIINISTQFLWMNMLSPKNIALAAIAAVVMFLNMKIMTRVRPATPNIPWANAPDMTKMMGFMNIFLVVMIGWFVYNVAAGIGLYITTSTLFAVIQMVYQNRILVQAKMKAIFQK